MRQGVGSLILALFALILLSSVCSTNLLASENVAVTGTVHAVDYDNEGNAIAAIISGTGGEYQIVDNAVGRQLFKLDKKIVEARGVVGEDSEGNLTIAVFNYKILSE